MSSLSRLSHRFAEYSTLECRATTQAGVGWEGMLADSLENFTPYGFLHFGALVAMTLVGIWLGVIRRKLRHNESESRLLDRQVAAVVLAIWIISQGIEFLPWRFYLPESLPFHICD